MQDFMEWLVAVFLCEASECELLMIGYAVRDRTRYFASCLHLAFFGPSTRAAAAGYSNGWP